MFDLQPEQTHYNDFQTILLYWQKTLSLFTFHVSYKFNRW